MPEVEQSSTGGLIRVDPMSPERFTEAFNSKAYLQDFYSCVDDPAMQMVVLFLPNIVMRLENFETLLDFGAGPTIHVAAAFRNKAQKMYLADYLPQNRLELQNWLNGSSDFDWSETLKKIATVEGVDWAKVREMEQLTRAKVKGIFSCDCHQRKCIDAPDHLQYTFDVVSTIFCLEYSSNTLDEYKQAVRNVTDQIKPGGFFVVGGVLEETWCSFGGQKFPCLFVTEEVLFDTLRNCGLLVDDPKETICYNVNGMYLICTRKRPH